MSSNGFANRSFGGQGRAGGGGFRSSVSENGVPVSDLRVMLAKKQAANITDLRTKLKPKALYTSKLSSRSQPPMQGQGPGPVGASDGKGMGRKPLKLTASFKNSVSSAVSGSARPPSKSSPRGSHSGSSSHTRSRSSSASYKLPSYEEAKKISVTVPGLNRPQSEVREYTYVSTVHAPCYCRLILHAMTWSRAGSLESIAVVVSASR